ncbi:MAG: DUF3857 domain-containing protein [bacterium]
MTSFERHVRMKALNRAGIDEIGEVSIPFPEKTGIEVFEAQTISPDGTISVVDEKDLRIKTIDDERFQVFAFPSMDSGSIVEYHYKFMHYQWPGYYRWYFNRHVYTLLSEFTMGLNYDCEYVYRPINLPPARQRPRTGQVEGAAEDSRIRCYTWTLTKLPPIKEEPFMTCVQDYQSAVYIQIKKMVGIFVTIKAIESWDKMGSVFEDFVKDYLTLPRGFRETIRKLTRKCDTKYAKSKALYKYVVNSFETRQDRYSTYRWHKNMSGLWKERYGGAWEKNLLLLEMLRKAGIDSWPVLICPRDGTRFDPNWISFDQFSHMILFAEVEQGGIYLDASSRYCTYGTLPPQCRVDGGLLVDGEQSGLVRVVTNDPRSSRFDVTSIKIDSEGNATCSTTCKLTGYLASEYGWQYESMPPDDFLHKYIFGGLLPEVQELGHKCDFDSLGRFEVLASYRLDGFAAQQDDGLIAWAPNFLFGRNPFESFYRFFPIDFNYAFTYHGIVTLEAEDTSCAFILPADTAFRIDGIDFIRQCQVNGPQATIQYMIDVSRPVFAVGEYATVREMFDRVARVGNDPVLLTAQGK